MAKRYYDENTSGKFAEKEGAGMIHENPSAVANLPQEVMMKPYPKTSYDSYGLNDTISGVDVQMRDDSKRKKGGSYPEKY